MYCFLKGWCPEINPTLQEHSTTSIQDTAHPPCRLVCLLQEFTGEDVTQTGKESQLSHSMTSRGMDVVLAFTFT